MKKIIYIASIFIAIVAASCTSEIWKHEYIIIDPVDTLKQIDKWYLEDAVTVNKVDDDKNFKAVSLYLDRGNSEIYIANEAGKSVDVLDAQTLVLKRSMGTDRTAAHDVYVCGDHVFVACGGMCEVQIFDRTTGEYLTRIGGGKNTYSLSWAGCVAATDRFVFVRDSREVNIRVFKRDAIQLDRAAGSIANNTVFARLGTESLTGNKNFIGTSAEPNTGSYDMEVVKDSLYAFVYGAGVIYSYSINAIAAVTDPGTNSDDSKWLRPAVSQGVKVYSASIDEDGESIWLALDLNGVKTIAKFSIADFQKRDFSKPLVSFVTNVRNVFPAQPMIAVYDQRLAYTNSTGMVRWNIVNRPSYIIAPKNGAGR